MKYTGILISCMIPFLCSAQSNGKLHKQPILVDTHNDILTACFEHGYSFDQNLKGKTHSDLQRFKQGGVDVQVFSIWCDGVQKDPFRYANRQIDTLYATTARHPGKIRLVRTPRDLERALQEKSLGAMIGVEGGHMIEDSMVNLDRLYNRGARYMTLTWNNSTSWASSAADETGNKTGTQKRGLNEFGKELVRHMNSLGMLVDISHVGEQTFWDVMATTTKPVIASHSAVYSLCPHFRNLKDDQIRAIGKNGGVIQLNFYSGFLDSTFLGKMATFDGKHKEEKDSLIKINAEPRLADEQLYERYAPELQAMRPPLSLLLDHLDYIVKLIGVDGVGLGSDFDGIESTPQGLDDVTAYPVLTKALAVRGYSKEDIIKILGGNFIRVFRANTTRQ